MMTRLFAGFLALCASVAFGATTVPVQLLNPAGSSSGQAIVSTGSSSAPAWGGVGVNGIGSIAANTVLANATSASASPTAFAMPSCSTSTSAIQWTSGSGFTCGTVAGAGANGNITSLTGLTTPLGTWAGGLGANNSASTGVVTFSTGTASVTTTPDLGTPSAVILTNGTGLPISTGVSGLGTGVASALGSAVTGSGGVVLATSPTITTPNVQGVTSGGTAAAGQVGEVIPGSGSAVSLTSGTPANCTSISLAAGDWDVWGNVQFSPAGTTVTSAMQVGLNTTTAALPSTTFQGILQFSSTGVSQAIQAPMQIINVASTTTVYLVAQATFTTSTETVSCQMAARRMH